MEKEFTTSDIESDVLNSCLNFKNRRNVFSFSSLERKKMFELINK